MDSWPVIGWKVETPADMRGISKGAPGGAGGVGGAGTPIGGCISAAPIVPLVEWGSGDTTIFGQRVHYRISHYRLKYLRGDRRVESLKQLLRKPWEIPQRCEVNTDSLGSS